MEQVGRTNRHSFFSKLFQKESRSTHELNTDGSLFGLMSQDPRGWSGSAGEAPSGEWSGEWFRPQCRRRTWVVEWWNRTAVTTALLTYHRR